MCAYWTETNIEFSRTGKLNANVIAEFFNGTLRDEWLNGH